MNPLNYMFRILVLFLLLILSGFFSASETALMSISKIRVRHMLDEKVKGADMISKLLEKPGKLLSTILVGNNAVNIGASALATSLAIDLFPNNGVAIATVAMTILVLIFAEITPKSYAAKKAEAVSLKVVGPMNLVIVALKPIVSILTYVTNGIASLLGLKIDKDRPFITEDELKTLVNVSHEEGVLEVDEKQMIHNVFEFGDMSIRDVMIQRTDIVAININASFQEIIEIFKQQQFSRYPVYEESIDNITGMLYVKDLFFVENNNVEFTITNYIRKPIYTFEFKKISDVFKEMKKNRIHISVVLDEYGGTAGIVTMEDMIEEIVGEIQDEYDENEVEINALNDNEYLLDGATRINDINELLNINIETEEFDSIGGFIIGELGRLPKTGEAIKVKDISFKVETVEKNRVKNIRVHK
ncbi:HlyC/CorC family transporter [Alkaliphilus pronyensis]|uniref:HlyC/CorC family transporter n=2 Tax=Alkaliphilus pronyensis TaxID=1482732 RepID=A0A6I0F6E4_9FIRM|nr:hemolysin family protein [Alkaliphilus pronyensis]KAB3532765.1 HlyC/CorC family transporter [Alkaliphilus pronyensis]